MATRTITFNSNIFAIESIQSSLIRSKDLEDRDSSFPFDSTIVEAQSGNTLLDITKPLNLIGNYSTKLTCKLKNTQTNKYTNTQFNIKSNVKSGSNYEKALYALGKVEELIGGALGLFPEYNTNCVLVLNFGDLSLSSDSFSLTYNNELRARDLYIEYALKGKTMPAKLDLAYSPIYMRSAVTVNNVAYYVVFRYVFSTFPGLTSVFATYTGYKEVDVHGDSENSYAGFMKYYLGVEGMVLSEEEIDANKTFLESNPKDFNLCSKFSSKIRNPIINGTKLDLAHGSLIINNEKKISDLTSSWIANTAGTKLDTSYISSHINNTLSTYPSLGDILNYFNNYNNGNDFVGSNSQIPNVVIS